MILAGSTIDVDEWVVGSFLLQKVVELGFEVVGVLFVQVSVDDLRDGHAADPMGEDGIGQSLD